MGVVLSWKKNKKQWKEELAQDWLEFDSNRRRPHKYSSIRPLIALDRRQEERRAQTAKKADNRAPSGG